MLGALLGLIALLSALLAGRALAHLAGERRPFVAATVGVAVLVLAIYGWGRLFQDLVVATALVPPTALAVVAFAWDRAPPVAAPALPRTRLGPFGWLGVLLVLGLGGYCVFHGYWWDEYSCHNPLVAGLARGVLPAEHPLFPGEPFRYHYAFDLLSAAVRALTGVDVARAQDVISLGLLGLLLGVARDLGATLGGQRAARLMPTILMLGTGTLLFLLFTDVGSIEVHWDLLPKRWLQSVPPPTISNFFQHPQALGMPMALSVLMLFDRGLDDPLRTRRSLLGALVMTALSLSQIVFFGTLGLVLGLVTLGLARRPKQRVQVVVDGGLLALSLVGAWLLGGFLAPGPAVESVLTFGKSYFTDPAPQLLAYHAIVFGLPFLALPLAIARTAKRPTPLRLGLVVAAVFGFLVPHFATYERSWDIVKFLGVGAFFANALFVDVLAAWPRRRLARPVVAAVTGALVLTVSFSSWIWLLRLGVLDGKHGIPKVHFPPPSKAGRLLGDRLAEIIGPGDLVFSTNTDLATAGGIPTPGFDWRQVGQGFMLDRDRSIRLAQHKAVARRSLDPKALAALEVQWLVLSAGDRAQLDATGQGRLQDPARFEHVEDIRGAGQTRAVYRVLPGALAP